MSYADYTRNRPDPEPDSEDRETMLDQMTASDDPAPSPPWESEDAIRDLAAYHNDDEWESQSRLKVLDESPSLYYGRFVAKNIPFKDTADMKLGRCLHAKVLQPDLFKELCPIMPSFQYDEANVTKDKKPRRTDSTNTEYYKNKKREFELANAGRDVIDADEMVLIRDMANAIWSHEDARFIIESPGENEVQHRWTDRIKRRGMMDLDRCRSLRVIADIKTITGPPDGLNFARNAARWRHYIQADYYTDLACDLHDMVDLRFLFICVNKKPPHEVAIHELKADDLAQAGERVESLVTELIRRRETENWNANWQRGVNSVPLPKWVWSNFYNPEDGEDGN